MADIGWKNMPKPSMNQYIKDLLSRVAIENLHVSLKEIWEIFKRSGGAV